MTSEHVDPIQRVSVTFKRSSTKDGGEGYDIFVGEGASTTEAKRVMGLAIMLRIQALAAISKPAEGVSQAAKE